MTVKEFDLPVTKDEHIRVIYQRPDDVTANDAADKPVVIMMHGFPGGHKSSSSDVLGETEHRLAKLGFASVRFDFRGCGESAGTEEEFCIDHAIADLNAVMQWCQHDAGHLAFVLLGESLGATIACIGYKPKLVKGLILLWPALILNQTSFKALFTREKMLEGDKSEDGHVMFNGHRLGKHFINEIYQYDLTSTLEKIEAPVLIQHGTADEDVPLTQAYFGRDHIPGMADLAIFEGGDHGLTPMNMRHHVFLNIEYFLTRHLKKPESQTKN